jgi:thioredoxin 1
LLFNCFSVKNMSEKDFFERIKHNPRPVVVDFWAPWCGPCRSIDPLIKKLGADYAGRVDAWKVNADEEPDILRSLRIYGIPTLVAFNSGQEVARRTGAASPAILVTLFESALSGVKSVQSGPAPFDRLLRLVAGIALLILAFQGHFSGLYLLVAGLGAVVAFSAVYDRCPIYRAVSTHLVTWLHKERVDRPDH